ncbi:MAG TPA: addiction module protein [Thermoanaerobaculia bacterium]|jgi:putative addiction module component (TIGR02574 family)
MSAQLLKVEEQALLLPPEDREALVDRLLRSLQEEALPEIDPAWIAEAKRRYCDYREGRVDGIPAEQVFDDIEQELGWSG